MKRLFLIAPLSFFFMGCNKLMPVVMAGQTISTPAKITVLVMGQSNAQRLPNGGYDGFRSIYSQAQFINCAVGGTGLNQWQKGGALYTACLNAVGGAHIDMIIWVQGEYEAEGGACDCAAPSSTWSQDFTAIANHFKTDFKAPVYFSRLGDFVDPSPWWADVRAQQTMTTVGPMVSLDGIAPIPGDRHYTNDGYYQIGKRFALAYQEGGH